MEKREESKTDTAIGTSAAAADGLVISDDIEVIPDTDELAAPNLRELSTSPPVIRGLIAIGLGALVILLPDSSLTFAARAAGLALLFSAATILFGRVKRNEQGNVFRAVRDALAGAVLVAAAGISNELVVFGLATALLVRSGADAISAVKGVRAGGESVWLAVRSFCLLSSAAAVLILGQTVVMAVLLVIGLAWVIAGLLAVVLAVTSPARITADSSFTPRTIVQWFETRDVGDDLREQISANLIFEGPDFIRRVVRFVVLMSFATAIAALGVQSDSTAVVIGAMLVAPLMTPIMATSLSLVMGQPIKAVRSLALVAVGVAIAIALAFLIALYVPGLIELGVNSQISSRTTPTLLDLLIALAAGGAGGYAVCRPDVSDSLPGVAIAVALVPPLAVVGITLANGEYSLSAGAMLLFMTNLIGIIVASGAVFVATGIARWDHFAANPDQLYKTSMTLVAAMAVVAIPLGYTGNQIIRDSTDHGVAESTTVDWLDASGQDLDIVRVGLSGGEVEVVLLGDANVSATSSALADSLADELDRQITLSLRVIPEQRITIEANGS